VNQSNGNDALRSVNLRITALLSLFLALGLTCVAADSRQTIVVDGQLPKLAKSILNLRIEKINLSGISMDAALRQIADAIEISSYGKLHFSYGVGFANSEVEEYVRKRIPEGKWKLRDPRIEIHATNTTLRDVIQRLCDQSGWSYKSTAIGIAFIDDGSYFNQKR
jgi:hypothetical protein